MSRHSEKVRDMSLKEMVKMSTHERNQGRAHWATRTLIDGDYQTMSQRVEMLDRLAGLPFDIVVEACLRDGFDIHELIRFVKEDCQITERRGNLVPFPKR